MTDSTSDSATEALWNGIKEVTSEAVPHIVVCRETTTGVVSYLGPYPSRVEAEESVALAQAAAAGDTDDELLEYHVAPLCPGAGISIDLRRIRLADSCRSPG